MKLVTSSPQGTAYSTFQGSGADVSGKREPRRRAITARTKLVGKETYNLTFVGYYPSEHPRVAFSVVVPTVQDDHDPVSKTLPREQLTLTKSLKRNTIKITNERAEHLVRPFFHSGKLTFTIRIEGECLFLANQSSGISFYISPCPACSASIMQRRDSVEQDTQHVKQFQSKTDLHAVLTSNGRIMYISANCKSYFSYSQEEMIGSFLKTFLHEEDQFWLKVTSIMSII